MSRSSAQRKGWGLLLPLVTVVSLSACGDDDESAGTCGARDDLQEALSGLASTEALDEAVDDVDDALDELGSAAEDTYRDDVDRVQHALDELTSAVTDGSADDVTSALRHLVSSVTDLMNKVAEEC